jgi:hypothetical protein
VLGIVLTPHTVTADPLSFPFFTMGDIEAFAHVLGNERGWSRTRVQRRVRGVDPQTIVTALLQENGKAFTDRGAAEDADATSALLLEVPVSELPDPLPNAWTVVRRTAGHAAVMILAPSLLDWSRSSLCAGEGQDERCILADDVGAGSAQRLPDRGRLVLRLPVAPTSTPSSTSFFMPRLRDVCGGRIVGIPGAESTIAPDQRHAVLVTGANASRGDVVIEWDQGSRECPANFTRPMAPFFVEAPAPTAAALETIIRRRER